MGRFRSFALLCTLICERCNQDQCVEYYYCTKKQHLFSHEDSLPSPFHCLSKPNLKCKFCSLEPNLKCEFCRLEPNRKCKFCSLEPNRKYKFCSPEPNRKSTFCSLQPNRKCKFCSLDKCIFCAELAPDDSFTPSIRIRED